MNENRDFAKATIVCLGDSITYGYPLGSKYSWVEMLRQKTGLQLVNQGVNGDTTGNMLARFPRAVRDRGATHVHLLGGANDAYLGIDLNTALENIVKLVRLSQQCCIIPIIGLPTPVCFHPAQSNTFFPGETQLMRLKFWLDEYSNWLREYTQWQAILLIDYHDPLCLSGTDTGDPAYFGDECHLNEHGNEQMTAVALKAMQALFHLD